MCGVAYNKDPDNNHTYTYIHSALFVAIKHPASRSSPVDRSLALDVVLPLCCSSNDRLRGMSIFALCSQIGSEGFVLGEVQEFARALLASLPLEPAAAAAPDAGECCVAVMGATYVGKVVWTLSFSARRL
jgi:hypothetical protein